MADADTADRIEELLKRAERAWEKKRRWDPVYREAYRFGMPGRDPGDGGGPALDDEVFDSTAATATARFANRMQSNLFPPFQRWCGLEAGPLVPDADKEKVNEALQQVTEKFFAIIDVANFNTAINEFLLELAAGTAVMFIEEDRGRARASPVRFNTVPAAQVALEEGPWGSVEGIFRRHKLAGRLIARTWRGARLPDELAEQVDKDPETEVALTETTFYDADRNVWTYDVLLDTHKVSILRRPVRYEENPWIVCRWVKAVGEVHGRGPLVAALPDIKTLNKVVELILKNASLAVAGAYTATDDGVINPNTVRIVPGAVVPVARNAGHPNGPSLAALPRAGDFNVAQLARDDLRMVVKKALFDDTLPPDAGPIRSATEIMERQKDLADDIGAAFGRLMSELVQPLVQRVLGLMHRTGLIELPVKITGYLVQVKVTSPLARLQNSQDVHNVIQWLQLIGIMGPEMMLLSAKVEDIGAWIGNKLGVPQDLIRPEGERGKLQQQVGRMMAANAMAQNPTAAAAMGGADGGGAIPMDGGMA